MSAARDKQAKSAIREVARLTALARKHAAAGREEEAVKAITDASYIARTLDRNGYMVDTPFI